MVAPNYAQARSELAKSMGLGARRIAAVNGASDQDEAAAPAAERREAA
jgi:predicted transcriptional regulator